MDRKAGLKPAVGWGDLYNPEFVEVYTSGGARLSLSPVLFPTEEQRRA